MEGGCISFSMADIDTLRAMAEKFANDVWLASLNSQQKGKLWESEFESECAKRGLHVLKCNGRHDFLINGIKTQCKATDRIENGRVWINNSRPVKANGNHRGYTVGEYEVMALKSLGRIFLIPATSLVSENSNLLADVVSIQHAEQFEGNLDIFIKRNWINPQPTLFS